MRMQLAAFLAGHSKMISNVRVVALSLVVLCQWFWREQPRIAAWQMIAHAKNAEAPSTTQAPTNHATCAA